MAFDTVGPGKTYANLGLWVAAATGNDALCFKGDLGTASLTTGVNGRTVAVAAGEGHEGSVTIGNTAARIVMLNETTNFGLDITGNNITVDGLFFTRTGTTDKHAIYDQKNVGTIVKNNLFFKDASGSGFAVYNWAGVTAATCTVYNNTEIIAATHTGGASSFIVDDGTGSMQCFEHSNNTMINLSAVFGNGIAYLGASTTIDEAHNNACHGTGTPIYQVTVGPPTITNASNNMSSDATAPGTSPHNNKSAASQYATPADSAVFLNATVEGVVNGTNREPVFSTDATGKTRLFGPAWGLGSMKFGTPITEFLQRHRWGLGQRPRRPHHLFSRR